MWQQQPGAVEVDKISKKVEHPHEQLQPKEADRFRRQIPAEHREAHSRREVISCQRQCCIRPDPHILVSTGMHRVRYRVNLWSGNELVLVL